MVKRSSASLTFTDRRHTYLTYNQIIHTVAVRQCIDDHAPNRVLGMPPPEISPTERCLPRKTRCVLAQLRSGFSTHTKTYLHSLDDSIPDECPDYGHSPHDVHHLFQCEARPTELKVEDLWKKPAETASWTCYTSTLSFWFVATTTTTYNLLNFYWSGAS